MSAGSNCPAGWVEMVYGFTGQNTFCTYFQVADSRELSVVMTKLIEPPRAMNLLACVGEQVQVDT